jgi:hypothetical protein
MEERGVGFGKRLGAVEQSCARWGLSFTKGGDSEGGKIRPMIVMSNFVERSKCSSSFIINKLK